jgi:hypothetical protein
MMMAAREQIARQQPTLNHTPCANFYRLKPPAPSSRQHRLHRLLWPC